MKIICIIPSRLNSTRLPRKALLPIQGKPMIQWTYENAARCSFLDDVIVATDHAEIAETILKVGGRVAMTPSELPTGSERVAEVAEKYTDANVIINLQGDEPFIKPKILEQLVAPYLAGQLPEITTLAYPLTNDKYHHPGAVKVVTDLKQNALYFTRAPVPYYRLQDKAPVYHHMGVYAYRRDFLFLYRSLPMTQLEKIEGLEQMRILEHGFKIRVCFTEHQTLEVNTEEEYVAAQRFEYVP